MAKDEYARNSISMRWSRWKMVADLAAKLTRGNRSHVIEMAVEEKAKREKVK